MTMLILKKGTAIILVLAIGLLFAGCKDEAPPPQPPQQPEGWSPEERPSDQSEEPVYQQEQQDPYSPPPQQPQQPQGWSPEDRQSDQSE